MAMIDQDCRLPDISSYPELAAEGQRWLEQLESGLPAGGMAQLEPALSGHFGAAFACSPFIGKTLVAHPEWLSELLAGLVEPFTAARFQSVDLLGQVADIDECMRLLRQLRQREMVRIGLRDLFGWADLQETLAALSGLADYCIQQAHAKAYQLQAARHGQPQNEQGDVQSLVVLAMGKLGGRELNYSSDIDLIFAYPEAGQTAATESGQRAIDNHRFFLGQAQQMIKLLHETTVDGFVFRVDTRLRPFGDSGALAVSFDFMESYYQNQGRDWERYAMIKARAVAGDSEHCAELQKMLQPFVYRRYLDYGAFSALRDMKSLIEREVERKGMQDNIKLGSGGIREVEFIGQAYQLIRGGREPAFRQREILAILAQLAERDLLAAETVAGLQQAYEFLRNAENRLQMINDQQVHQLPPSPLERQRLAYAMGFGNWAGFHIELDRHRALVSDAFNNVFFSHDVDETPKPQELRFRQILDGKISVNEAPELFAEFADVDSIYAEFNGFIASHTLRHSTPQARDLLARLLPSVLRQIAPYPNANKTLHRVLQLIQAVLQRPVYLALLVENPSVLRQMVKLFAASAWIADYLLRQPILLDSLLDTRQLYHLPSKDELLLSLQSLVQAQTGEDDEQRLNALRHFKQEQTLRIAAVDVSEHLPLMKVSDQLSWLAEALLSEVHNIASKELQDKFGPPSYVIDGKQHQPGLLIIGYGKLGGIELGYGSDLDLVFLHNSAGEQQQTQGKRSIDNQTYFHRFAQRLIHWLSTSTLGGVLYETDLRLRPDGASGLLVSSLQQFEQYQRERAWVWEHQALVRARPLVGNPELHAAFSDVRHRILTQPRESQKLKHSVLEMRNRMRSEVSKSRHGEIDLKHDRGGLGDIEFLVQYGVLAWANQHPELSRFPDNIRILEQFGQLGLMPQDETEFLADAYRTLREQIHRRSLQGASAVVAETGVDLKIISGVGRIWRQWMETG